MSAKPMLDDLELQQVQKIEAMDHQVLAQHGVPALEGDFFQDLGRRVTRVNLLGVMTGSEAGEQLKTLRLKFRNAEPVSFVSDIATATTVDKVLIEEFGVRELAGKPARYEYALTLREFIKPPAFTSETPPPAPAVDEEVEQEASDLGTEQIDQASNDLGTLEVVVQVADGTGYEGIRVVVEGTTSEAAPMSTFSDEQVEGVYTFTNIQAGDYTVKVELA